MTQAIILLAHGSRDERWKKPFEELLASIQKTSPNQSVGLAYMEMTNPTLDETALLAIEQGATQLMILPLFMASGGHLRHDVPQQVARLQQQYPHVSVILEPPVGEHALVQQAMQQVIQELFAV